ncbi:Sec-independent protein translocase protein TatB [Arenimonas caeni]|jgi:sec-independent protein translocase protein TatB|uniref:Sec-independent protein translocase protein TatB n=1 Tax=Arenimonas caeni TaxID=2058085 RepID=UPI002A36FD70|nr:Sec-independent protein translocase protein TatB [Arenimonas caeni]MDY0020868.1 Sec-independent protein translocase protein TatB [Arenimonas caeni]
MFDLGFGELLVIGVVALVVLGPERLPRAARFAGLWVRKARAQWYSVKSEFERELAAEDMRKALGDPAGDLRRQADGLRRELDEAGRAAAEALRDPEAAPAEAPRDAATDPDDGGKPADDAAAGKP